MVVTACSDGVVRVYDAHSGQCIRYRSTICESISLHSSSLSMLPAGIIVVLDCSMVTLGQSITLHLMGTQQSVEGVICMYLNHLFS